ncbi:type VI secretion system contractile sheath small subunit, partial [Escherichia coli]
MSKMNNNGGSVAPKERISVRYTPKVDGVAADIELPLNLLITGNLKGKPDNTPLD